MPLKGKYYGTVVDIGRSKVTVWLPFGDHYAASVREIANGWEPEDGFDHVETQESYEAAKLVSAAPDMLEALMALLNYVENTESELGITLDSAEKARAAISKATT